MDIIPDIVTDNYRVEKIAVGCTFIMKIDLNQMQYE